MDKIICLVGESGSGKTTICKELEKEGYNVIKSYTTREPRHANEYGHIFIDSVDIYDTDEMIAYTYFDYQYYWATREQYQHKGISLYPIDTKGIEMIRKTVKDAEIVVIYLNCSNTKIFQRLWKRYKDIGLEPYEISRKVNSRVSHDKEAFKVIKCDYAIDTDRELEEVLKDIRRIVEGN